MQWVYEQPVKIIFGGGKIKELSDIIKDQGYEHGILVCDPFFRESTLVKELLTNLGSMIKGIYSDVSPNPDVKEVDKCVELLRKENSQFIIALGGGSTMDLSKAASVAARTGKSITFYHGTGEALPSEGIPLIAVPTTSGTGSEVTGVAVLTDKDKKLKAPIGVAKALYARIALIDYELTYSVPARITAGTGIDVLSHAVEGYWSIGHQPVCDAMAVHAIKNVFGYLEKACTEPDNEEARCKMAEASVIAGLAFSLPKTTSSHACSFPLTQIYHIPHGEACGLTLDYFIRYNSKHDEDGRINALVKTLGFSNGDEFADAVASLKETIGTRCDLKDLEITEEALDDLVKRSRHPNLLNNPCEISDEVLYDMYRGMI